MHINQLNLASAASIQVVSTLPVTGARNYAQSTLFKVSDKGDSLYRLTRPIVNSTPALADFELVVRGDNILSVIAVGGSLASKAGDTVAGLVLASGDKIVFGTGQYTVGAAASTLDFTFTDDYIIHCDNDQVWSYNHQNTSLIRLDSIAGSYNANTTAGTTFDATKDYQVFNGDLTIDVSLMNGAASTVYSFQCLTNDAKITFSNGTVQNSAISPVFTSTTAQMFVGDTITVRKIASNLVSVTF
jgi:hypothetical protein